MKVNNSFWSRERKENAHRERFYNQGSDLKKGDLVKLKGTKLMGIVKSDPYLAPYPDAYVEVIKAIGGSYILHDKVWWVSVAEMNGVDEELDFQGLNHPSACWEKVS
jgi:hypothetical protein